MLIVCNTSCHTQSPSPTGSADSDHLFLLMLCTAWWKASSCLGSPPSSNTAAMVICLGMVWARASSTAAASTSQVLIITIITGVLLSHTALSLRCSRRCAGAVSVAWVRLLQGLASVQCCHWARRCPTHHLHLSQHLVFCTALWTFDLHPSASVLSCTTIDCLRWMSVIGRKSHIFHISKNIFVFNK